MCGIVAVIDPTLDAQAIGRLAGGLNDLLAHRGPDDLGVWVAEGGGMAIAHRRLAIRGLGPQGAQPMVGAAGVLAFNGELFGVEPLVEDLRSRGTLFRGSSDTEVLYQALRVLGVRETLERIRGQFAFAWVDVRERALYLARDPLGIRPLYYALDGQRLVAASEQKAVLGASWVSREPRHEALLRYLVLGRTDDVPGETLLQHVASLPPGHVFTSRRGETRLEFYRRLPASVPRATVGDVRRELERSVEEQLVSDVTVGCMVSGGLDSASVVALADRARRRAGTPSVLHLFAYHDQLAEQDERVYQRAVAEAVTSPHELHWVSSSPEMLRAEWDRYVHHQEEPYGDASSYAEYCIGREAAACGVKVLLNGLGGDEVFVGYPSFYGPLTLDLLKAGGARSLAALAGSAGAVLGRKRGGWMTPLAGAAYHFLPARFRNVLTALRTGRTAGLDPGELLRAARDAYGTWHVHDGQSSINAALRGALESWSVPRFLAHSDRMTLAHGVEGRVPLLDEGLITAAFGIPPGERVGRRGLKAALRLALDDVLPPPVRDRAWKLGFHAPLAAYVRALEEPLRSGHGRLLRLVGGPRWDGLATDLRWRWGNLGSYLGWVERLPAITGAVGRSQAGTG